MLWILKISLCWMLSLSLISFGMVILPRTPTLMVYSAMYVDCRMCLYGFCENQQGSLTSQLRSIGQVFNEMTGMAKILDMQEAKKLIGK